MAKQFYLYERKRNGKPSVWYVRFRTEENTISSPVCTHLSDKKEAEDWAVERLAKGDLKPTRRPGAPSFEDWATDWWVYDKCPYIAEKRANGYNISRKYAALRRGYLDNYLIPEFGRYRITELKPRKFRDYKMQLFKEGNIVPATINCVLGTARVMFNYAVEMGELELNPVSPVKELKETPKERGILTAKELLSLFGPDALETVWGNDLRYYACNLLAASTGMRMGECQALQVQYVHKDYVRVVHGWNDRYGIAPPKCNSVRLVPIPQKTSDALQELIDLRRWGDPLPEDIVIWGKDRNTPLSKTAILRNFKKALRKIGIDDDERKRRVLLFHSYRHGFNSMIRGKVPDEQLRRVTGHKTLSMSDQYDHVQIEHLQDVKETQETLFS